MTPIDPIKELLPAMQLYLDVATSKTQASLLAANTPRQQAPTTLLRVVATIHGITGQRECSIGRVTAPFGSKRIDDAARLARQTLGLGDRIA